MGIPTHPLCFWGVESVTVKAWLIAMSGVFVVAILAMIFEEIEIDALPSRKARPSQEEGCALQGVCVHR
jgi:hypothetical protein